MTLFWCSRIPMLTGAHIAEFLSAGKKTVVEGTQWVTRSAWVGPFWVREGTHYQSNRRDTVRVSVFLPDLSILVGGPYDPVLFKCTNTSADGQANEMLVFEEVAHFLTSLDYHPFLSLGEKIKELQVLAAG